MNIEILADADAVARKAAEIIAAEARATVAERGRFIMAVSGGHTPWKMLRALANEKVPWEGVRVVQVDERVAPAGDPDRNLSHLCESLLEHAPLLARRRCSTSLIWASDQMATLPRWFPEIRF
jgi:6-phosphogluconolactonase/glucosamine-6-phosphate isomerase/deaminase